MASDEMFKQVGMKLYSSTYLLFEFLDERESYVFFDKEKQSVELFYKITDFETRDKFELFKQAIDEYIKELGWLK